MSDTTTPAPGLDEVVRNAVLASVTPEYIDAKVRQHVDRLVDEAIKDALGSWSTTGKTIKKAVEESLQVNKLDLPSYGQTVTRMVSEAVERIVADVVNARLQADVEKMLKLAPKTIRLSEIVATVLEEREDVHRVQWSVDHTGHGPVWLTLHDGWPSFGEKPSVRVLISIPNYAELEASRAPLAGTICGGWVGGGDIKKGTSLGSYGLEHRILAMYACGTVIVLDENDVVSERD